MAELSYKESEIANGLENNNYTYIFIVFSHFFFRFTRFFFLSLSIYS